MYNYQPATSRYSLMTYQRCGSGGLLLPAISLGLWNNFSHNHSFDNARALTRAAFDLGITHFDLANNYGPPPGSAEETMGRIMAADLRPHRDELIISTKAGYAMWDGPYGDNGSRKYLLASLDQSLQRLGLDYVDIFYSHRMDLETPLEETMGALDTAVRSGRALYAGISNYDAEHTRLAVQILSGLGTPCLIHQPAYSMLRRDVEDGVLTVLEDTGIGCIAFSPLFQGILTDKYLQGIPEQSRAADPHGTLTSGRITPELLSKIQKLNEIARGRGQSLAQMALAWVLRQPVICSALIGASRPAHLAENVKALDNLSFSEVELQSIDAALQES